jgi:hypothetical protein
MSNKHTSDPEALANVGQSDEQHVGPGFVNQGIPATPLATLEDRKTGKVSDSANAKLRDAMNNNQNLNEGMESNNDSKSRN